MFQRQNDKKLMLTQKTKPISENDIQKITEQYLSTCLANGEEQFNQQLKEQFDDIITAIIDSLPGNDQNQEEVRQSVQKHVKAFWLA